MSNGDLRERVLQALTGVRHPETGRDVVESGHVQGLEVEEGGDVLFTFAIQADDPGGLVREARGTVEALDGVGIPEGFLIRGFSGFATTDGRGLPRLW